LRDTFSHSKHFAASIHMLMLAYTGRFYCTSAISGSEILRSCHGTRFTTGIRNCATTTSDTTDDIEVRLSIAPIKVLEDVGSRLSINPHHRLRPHASMLDPLLERLQERSFQGAQVDSTCLPSVDSINCGCLPELVGPAAVCLPNSEMYGRLIRDVLWNIQTIRSLFACDALRPVRHRSLDFDISDHSAYDVKYRKVSLRVEDSDISRGMYRRSSE
jgi:hypothetical protein